MSLLHYLFNVPSALVSPVHVNNHSTFQFFQERNTGYIDSSGNATSLKTVLPSVADSVLERLLDHNDLLSMQIICILQPSFNEYDDFIRRDTGRGYKTGWLRRFIEEVEHIRSNLQIFILHSSCDAMAFVPYKPIKQDLNGVPTIAFTHHLLLLLQSAESIDEENAILTAIVFLFIRELHHLLLHRRPYLSKKAFEILCSKNEIQDKILGGLCSLVELSSESCKQQRLAVRFEGDCQPLIVRDGYIEDLLTWLTGVRASGHLTVPFIRPDLRCIVGSCDDEATIDMLQSSRIRVRPDIHHHIYQVDSPLQDQAESGKDG